MADFRFVNGIARGRFNNFAVQSDNLFISGDTSPDVTLGCQFYTQNTSNTSITYFDLTVTGPIPGATGHGNIAPGFQGKEFRLIFLDDSTTLVRSAQLILNGDDLNIPLNTVMDFTMVNSAWYETYRSVNQSRFVQIESKNVTGSILSLGTGQVSVRGIDVVRLRGEVSSSLTLIAAKGGYEGQRLTLMGVGASDSTVIVNSASNIDGTFVVTSSTTTPTQFRLMSSGAISFMKHGNQWLEIRPVSGNSSGQLQ